MKRNPIHLAALGAFLLGALAPVPASASLEFGVNSTIAAPGEMGGSIDVVFQNTGSTAIEIASFTFGITTSDTDITFESSTTATSVPYIFAGDSLVDVVLGGVNSTTPPGQSLQAFDATFSTNNVSVGAGETVGLGHVSFDVLSTAALGPAVVSFVTSQSSLSSASGAGIPIDSFDSGIIDIVPEPSSVVTLLAALGFLYYRRRAQNKGGERTYRIAK